MPADADVFGTQTEERVLPRIDEVEDADVLDPYVVILYNDDHHAMDEVVFQIQKATGYSLERCAHIMYEAHSRGRAITYTGEETECERVAGVLRQIRLQVETDRF